MTKLARITLTGLAAVALISVLTIPDHGRAGGHVSNKKLAAQIQKIADAVQAGKKTDAAKMAHTLTKTLAADGEFYESMHLFNKSSRGGWSVPLKMPAGQKYPGGIELVIQYMSKQPGNAAFLADNKAALLQMGYRVAALAEMSAAAGGLADIQDEYFSATKPKSRWDGFSRAAQQGAQEFVSAVQSGKADQLKKAAVRLNNSCTGCHSVFK